MRPVAAAAILALAGVGVATGSAASPPRVADRTVVCRTAGEGYPNPVRHITVRASPRLGSQSPAAAVSNGPSGPGGVRADVRTGPYFGSETGSVVLSRFRCARTTLGVPLSSRPLRGGPTELGDSSTCEVPTTILIRIRAVFRNPVTFSPAPDARDLWIANGRITTASIAVTTVQKQRPIAFASVDDEPGKATLFVAPSRCVPN